MKDPHGPPAGELTRAERTGIVRDAVAVGVATGAYGISFGAIAVSSGLSIAQACALSLLVFTGASQFALVGVVAAGGAPLSGTATAPVLVDGEAVGSVGVDFPMGDRPGRPVAWAWILVAALAALAAAVAAGWLVVRQLTRPVAALTDAAHSFAAGDRDTVVLDRGPNHNDLALSPDGNTVAALRRP